MPCFSPLKGFRDKETGGIIFRRCKRAGEEMDVACGQCIGCRYEHSRTWGFRIMHEALLWPYSRFLTLTYRPFDRSSDEQQEKGLYCPTNGSLVKSHFQKFMKRLRKKFADRTVRYYQCGEYGDKLYRPHHHACLFNLKFPDEELFKYHNGNPLFRSQILDDLWSYGFCSIGQLTLESAMYTARYVTKKVTGLKAHDHYSRVDWTTGEIYQVEPEYATMSRKPGIGYEWFQQYKDSMFPSDEIAIPGVGVLPSTPRYYTSLLEAESPEIFEEVKKRRLKYRRRHAGDYTPRRLEDRYKVHMDKTRSLVRGYENET